MSELTQDVRYALRRLRKSPSFTATAVITLALGIGANTAAFTLLYGILLQSLPVPEPTQLYRIGDISDCCSAQGFPDPTGDFYVFSYDLYQHLRKSAPEFEQLAAVEAAQTKFSVKRNDSAAQSLIGQYVSGNFFAALGVGAARGRVFSDNDDNATATPVVVLSYSAWKRQFAGDPSIVGSTVIIRTHPFTVIGIAEQGFFGEQIIEDAPAIWLPLTSEPMVDKSNSWLHDPGQNWLNILGRVHRGTSIGPLQTRISESLRQWLTISREYADVDEKVKIPEQHVVIIPASRGIQMMATEYSAGLKTLMLLSTVVLLIACGNIANLLLARGIARRTELSIRVALGAARGRLLRQIFTESLLLSSIGGLAGLGVAYCGSYLILALTLSGSQSPSIHATPSIHVLAFTFVISLLNGILFGTAPARLALRTQPAEVLRGLNHSTRDLSFLPQEILLISQAALALVLLVGAMLTVRSLYNLAHQDMGIASANRYVLHLDVEGAGYTPERRPELYNKIQSRFARVGGVTGVGLAVYSFLEGYNLSTCVVPQGQAIPNEMETCRTTFDIVSAGYLDLMGVPMVSGREFTEQDTTTSPLVVIVNESFANRYYPNQNPIGKLFPNAGPDADKWMIVGVFKDFKSQRPANEMRPVFLLPLSQQKGASTTLINSIVIRFNHEPDDVDGVLRRTLARVDPSLTVVDLRSMDSQIAETLSKQRLIARLAIAFGLLALTLAAIGLYGATSYFVAQRTNEIGIRMALGSTRFGVILLVLRGVMWQIGLGLALGVPCTLLVGYCMKNLLYKLSWYDPAGLIAAAAVLTICAFAAGFIPARRAASIEPMTALRAE
jgi:macrolide transport system ATP-binding/permease protein